MSTIGDPGQSPSLSYYLGTLSPVPTIGEKIVLGIPPLVAIHTRNNHPMKRDGPNQVPTGELEFYPVNLDLYKVGSSKDSVKATIYYHDPHAPKPGLELGYNSTDGSFTFVKGGSLDADDLNFELQKVS